MERTGQRYELSERDAVMAARPLRFRADLADLRQWLSRRKTSLESVRREFEELWKDIRLNFEPNIGKALLDRDDRDNAESEREDDEIVNSAPRLFLHNYASGMQSGITPKSQPNWFQIVPKFLSERDQRDPAVSEWCAVATERIGAALERANFYRTSQNVYPHAALLGTSCVMIQRGRDGGDVAFRLIDEGDYWIAEDEHGNVDTLLRRMSITLAQARAIFLLGNLPENWRMRIADGRLEERVTVWNLICPNDGSPRFRDVPKDRPFASVYWSPSDASAGGDLHGIIEISSFGYKPFAVLRQFDSGSVYGHGLGEMSLPDCKELHYLERCKMELVAQEKNPSLLAPSYMKGRPINQYPGSVTFYDAITGAGAAPVTRLFDNRMALESVDAAIREVSDRIAKIWYNDLFAMLLQLNSVDRGQKTATEISELSREKVTLLGPVLTQMDEFLTDVIDAVFYILASDGLLPEPPEALRDGSAGISVEYTSAIHSEMKAAIKMRAVNTLVEMASMLAQAKPEALDKIDVDKIVDEVAKVYPNAAAFILSDRQVAELREQRARQQQEAALQQQYADMMKNAGANAKALSETQLNNGSALDALVGGIAQ